MHAMRDVKPGDLVKKKSDGTIHTVATNDPGACQVSLVALPLDPKDPDYEAKASHAARNGAPAKPLQAWDDFEAYKPELPQGVS